MLYIIKLYMVKYILIFTTTNTNIANTIAIFVVNYDLAIYNLYITYFYKYNMYYNIF